MMPTELLDLAEYRSQPIPPGVKWVHRSCILADNYRDVEDVAYLSGLAESMRAGFDEQASPYPPARQITVDIHGEEVYRLIAGHHRLEAWCGADYLDREWFPIRPQANLGSEQANRKADALLQARENTRKEDTELDIARACAKCLDAGATEEEAAFAKGLVRKLPDGRTIANLPLLHQRLCLLNLPPDLVTELRAGRLLLSAAQAIGAQPPELHHTLARLWREVGHKSGHPADRWIQAEAETLLSAPAEQGGLFDGDWSDAADRRLAELKQTAPPNPTELPVPPDGLSLRAAALWRANKLEEWGRLYPKQTAARSAQADALRALAAGLPDAPPADPVGACIKLARAATSDGISLDRVTAWFEAAIQEAA